jgi:hypothetical protein
MAFADDWEHWANSFQAKVARGWRDFLEAITSAYDYDAVSTNDANTDVTGVELEELTDGSETSLHSHAAATPDYGDISANDVDTDVTGEELEELTDGSETSLHSHAEATPDYDDISTNDADTNVTGEELEELTDGSTTTLHNHAIALPYANVYYTSGTDLSDSTDYDISFGGENADTGSFWAAGSPSRLTIPSAGFYYVTAWAMFEGGSTGVYNLKMRKNGGTRGAYGYASVLPDGTTSTDLGVCLSVGWVLAASDYLEFSVLQSSGGVRAIYQVYASIFKVG